MLRVSCQKLYALFEQNWGNPKFVKPNQKNRQGIMCFSTNFRYIWTFEKVIGVNLLRSIFKICFVQFIE